MSMRRQWEEIARQNPFYGVLSLDDFEDPTTVDLDRFWASGRRDVDAFLSLLELGDTQKLAMLEIGCGLGRMSHHFAGRFHKVYALDVSATMLERARQYWGWLPNIEWLQGNGEDLHQVGTASVHHVFSFMTLQHVPKASTILNYIHEASRVLLDEGVAFLQFRTVPEGLSLLAAKQCLATALPAGLSKPLRTLWGFVYGHHRTRDRFARQYECWRGCALRPSVIEATARAARLQVVKAADLGAQYRYYIFRKTGNSPAAKVAS